MFRASVLLSLLLFLLGGFLFSDEIERFHPLDNMPLVKPRGFAASSTYAPIEQRGAEYRKFLAASVKISVGNASGSGTICYYDATKNLAYVITCGHLWSRGIMTAEEGRRRRISCKVITWYKNETKLPAPKAYDATVVFFSYVGGQDSALVTFRPDWSPGYFPIAPANYKYVQGTRSHSCGCDGGREVSHYDVEIVGMQGRDLVTTRNSPRPGRSGGGLMDNKGYYIGTCWGTSSYNGDGIGYFTPLPVIHSWYTQNGYGWLLKIPPGGGIARQISVRDRNNRQGVYNQDYILVPSG